MMVASTDSDPARALLGEDGPVHFMGIGGAGMRGLAEALARAGVPVSGCDAALHETPASLVDAGVTVLGGHDPAHIAGASAVVRTAAVPEDHPELAAARAAGVPVMKRAEALGRWVGRGSVLAVAGTHGKTSTTAMLTGVLEAAGLDPTGLVGGHVDHWGGNLRAGADDLFVVEADEFDRSFLHLRPTVAVVTNVEADHLDIYGDFAGVLEAFRMFVDLIEPDGTLIACADDPGVSRLVFGHDREVITYGLGAGSMIRASGLERAPGGGTRFRIHEAGVNRGIFTISAPGTHNVRNALAAAAASRKVGASWETIREGLACYAGVGRRFQRLGHVRGVDIVDDYAHHPTEVHATLEAARREYPGQKLVAVFQPHLFSRTREFHREFGVELAKADVLWVTDVYPARERPLPGITGALVAEAARGEGGAAVRYHEDVNTLAEAVASTLGPGEVCVTLGAGSIERVGPEILNILENRA